MRFLLANPVFFVIVVLSFIPIFQLGVLLLTLVYVNFIKLYQLPYQNMVAKLLGGRSKCSTGVKVETK